MARASVSFDRVAARYDETRGGEKRGRELAGSVLPLLAEGPALEVGVGTGVVSAQLVASGVPAVGVDISAEMLARAVVRMPGRVARGDALALPVASGCVGTVLFVWSLHLVGSVAAAIAEAERVLRPAGKVIAIHAAPKVEPTDLDEAIKPLLPTRLAYRPDEDEQLDAAATAVGLVPDRHEWTGGYPIERSPLRAAQEIEERVWSYLWRLDEHAWQTTAVPVIEALRALPEPDRPRSARHWHRLSVFSRS